RHQPRKHCDDRGQPCDRRGGRGSGGHRVNTDRATSATCKHRRSVDRPVNRDLSPLRSTSAPCGILEHAVPDEINWGHVGTLSDYRVKLREITDMAFREANTPSETTRSRSRPLGSVPAKGSVRS